MSTQIALGKEVSERHSKRAEVDAWADAAADMLNAYLAQLSATRRSA